MHGLYLEFNRRVGGLVNQDIAMANHMYRRALESDRPILARIRSAVRLEHGVQTLVHLRLSLPALTSGGRKRAVVARTVNV